MKKRNQSQFYDGVWERGLAKGKTDFSALDKNTSFVLDCLQPSKNATILEVGCGLGNLCDRLYDQGYRSIIGTDISQVALFTAKKENPHLRFAVMEADGLAVTPSFFDICLSFYTGSGFLHFCRVLNLSTCMALLCNSLCTLFC